MNKIVLVSKVKLSLKDRIMLCPYGKHDPLFYHQDYCRWLPLQIKQRKGVVIYQGDNNNYITEQEYKNNMNLFLTKMVQAVKVITTEIYKMPIDDKHIDINSGAVYFTTLSDYLLWQPSDYHSVLFNIPCTDKYMNSIDICLLTFCASHSDSDYLLDCLHLCFHNQATVNYVITGSAATIAKYLLYILFDKMWEGYTPYNLNNSIENIKYRLTITDVENVKSQQFRIKRGERVIIIDPQCKYKHPPGWSVIECDMLSDDHIKRIIDNIDNKMIATLFKYLVETQPIPMKNFG
jgi:hypothetical protein